MATGNVIFRFPLTGISCVWNEKWLTSDIHGNATWPLAAAQLHFYFHAYLIRAHTPSSFWSFILLHSCFFRWTLISMSKSSNIADTHTHTTQWKWQCGNVCRYEEIDKENLCTRSRCPRLYLKYFTTFFFRSFAMQIRFARIYAESRYISGAAAAAARHEILAQTHLHTHTQGHWKLYLDRQPEVW